MENTRIIILDGDVNEGSSLSVVMELLYYDSIDHNKPIYLYLNSNGGSVTHGLAILDTIKHIKTPVYTVCCGICASMGAFLLSCGEKGHRYALKHSRVLIHQPLMYSNYSSAVRQSSISRMAESFTKVREELEKIMAENSGVSLEKMHNDCERDNWMSAQEAKDYGLIDAIIE